MLLSRDTAGDVGTSVHVESESVRGSPGDVATAAAKRVGEALRVLCEYAKLADTAVAADLDQLRYRFYDWEKSLAGAADRRRIAKARVYLLLTARFCRDGDWKSAARAAIDGGADVIQLREKDTDDGELLDRAAWLVEQCRAAGVLSVVNDRPDIARLAGADGVPRRAGRPARAVGAADRQSQPVCRDQHARCRPARSRHRRRAGLHRHGPGVCDDHQAGLRGRRRGLRPAGRRLSERGRDSARRGRGDHAGQRGEPGRGRRPLRRGVLRDPVRGRRGGGDAGIQATSYERLAATRSPPLAGAGERVLLAPK